MIEKYMLTVDSDKGVSVEKYDGASFWEKQYASEVETIRILYDSMLSDAERKYKVKIEILEAELRACKNDMAEYEKKYEDLAQETMHKSLEIAGYKETIDKIRHYVDKIRKDSVSAASNIHTLYDLLDK